MAKDKKPAQSEDIDDVPDKALGTKPEAGPETASGFTRCWLINHPTGGCRIFADTEAEALADYFKGRPHLDPEKTRATLTIAEILFVPADTERDKPHGWRRQKAKYAY